MNLETKITIYKFTPQLFTLTQNFVVNMIMNVHGKTCNISFKKERITVSVYIV